MHIALFRRIVGRWGRLLVSDAGLTFLCGLLSGCCVVSWLHQFTAQFGFSLPVVTGAAVAIGLALESARRNPVSGSHRVSGPGWLIGVAVWTAAFGWLIEMAGAGVGRVPLESMASPFMQVSVAVAAAVLLLAPPMLFVSRLPLALYRFSLSAAQGGQEPDGDSSLSIGSVLGRFLLGAAGGILLGVFVLSPAVGVSTAGLLASLAMGLLSVELVRRGSRRRKETASSVPAAPASVSAHASGSEEAWGSGAWKAITIGCLGGAVAVASRVAHQLMPVNAFVVWMEWASVIGGGGLGILLAARSWRRRSAAARLAEVAALRPADGSSPAVPSNRAACGGGSFLPCALAAAWCAVLPLLFSWHVSALLSANAFVSAVGLQMLIRSAVVASMLLPFGVAWGLLVAPGLPGSERREAAGSVDAAAAFRWRALAFVTGYLVVRWVGLREWGVPLLLTLGAVSFLAVGIVRRVSRFTRGSPASSAAGLLPGGWGRRAAVAAVVLLVAASPWLRDSYRPARAARLLFSTDVFLARRAGTPIRLLPYLDEGRLIAVREGPRHTYTVWKLRGVQLRIREGGIPKAVVATDARCAPQSSAEVMQAALPMVLHERAHRVLLLGLQGGVPLTTCLAFPVQQVTCVESDASLIGLVRDVVWEATGETPLQDDRLRFVPLAPALAVACDDGRYDVVVSSADQAALAVATPHFTRRFYRRVSDRLARDGIFCQRFQYLDFGSRPLQVLAKTARSVFETVAVIETASGELVLLATNSEKGLVRAGLAERLKAPHVRRTLARTGWDWVVPLNLSGYANDALDDLSSEDGVRENTIANGCYAFRLPQEMLRWGPKWREIGERLAGRAGSLLKWADGEDTDDTLRRLEEVAGRRNLIARFPDRKWSYRKTLKERMQNNPRTIIRQVKGEGLGRRLHPGEKRRKRYFEALGAAAKDPNRQSIARLTEFAAPYDPFVSYFLHDEAARLYSRCDPPLPRQELLHRLHVVYFSTGHDRSIRNVVAALELLAEEPAATAGPMDRRDQIDALLQILTTRWHVRGREAPMSKYIALRDAEMSIAAAESAFELMPGLYRQLDLDPEGWEARQLVLERTLVRPLRTYRARLLTQSKKGRRR